MKETKHRPIRPMRQNAHTGTQLDKLNDELTDIQTEMMDKARAIEARLSVIKMLEECEVNGHHWQLNGQPQSNLFRMEGYVELTCTRCGAFVNSDFKKIYLTVGHARVSIEHFIYGDDADAVLEGEE